MSLNFIMLLYEPRVLSLCLSTKSATSNQVYGAKERCVSDMDAPEHFRFFASRDCTVFFRLVSKIAPLFVLLYLCHSALITMGRCSR